ncbi:hypothetical protein JB92DRAFT_3147000 [Gautieria morchelliformis]|nr:hypothetical protein JB92DRAFT_3147000 [Gautieria morchelliformis]
MEKLMSVLAALFEQWWWSCQMEIWEQVLMLSAAIFSGIDTSPDPKGKRKDRDDETKRAAAQCLWAVLRRRELHQAATSSNRTVSDAEERFSAFQSRGRASKLLPILGQTLKSLLETSQSSNRGLQDVSLHIIYLLVTDYLTEEFIPSILPGTASAMAKVALGQQAGKGWSRGDAVDEALAILQATIVAAVGDEICEAEGALRSVTRLEDLGQVLESNGQPRPVASTGASPFFTPRTSVWLAATASQLHMVINTLPPLLSHPNPVALLSLSRFSLDLLSKTSRTLPDTLPLLLSFLLSLSTNQSLEVAASSHAHRLTLLLPPSTAHFTHLQILSQLTRNNLISLPVSVTKRRQGGTLSPTGVGMLLGPTGGIEKWACTSPLEGESLEGTTYNFPEVNMKHVSSRSTREALDDMFRALGAAAGTDCLFAVEWFVGVAKQGKTSREVGALWCAGRILEGVCGIPMESTDMLGRTVPKGVEKVSRWIAKLIAEFWDEDEDEDEDAAAYNNPSLHISENNDHLNSKAPEDHVESFLEWYQHRNDPIAQDTEDYGPAPREDWGNLVGKGKGKEVDEGKSEATVPATDVVNEPPPTPTQALTQQIVSRSIYFLTHSSHLIRARILSLLDTACPILSESALLPSIHAAWPYVLNRLGDSEPYAAASLIASLAENVGEFMTTQEADAHSALARRGLGAVVTQSAYSHSDRLYVSILRTMRAVVKGVQELQRCGREVYVTLMKENGDVVWLILSATMGKDVFGVADTTLHSVVFLREQKWNIEANARIILGKM